MKADINSKGGMILGHRVLAAFRKGVQPPILESDDYQGCIIQLSLDLVEGTVGGEVGRGGGDWEAASPWSRAASGCF